MAKTIQTALSPLLILGSFCGLSIFEYPLGQSWPRLTCLYLLIIGSLYAYFYYYLVYIHSPLVLYIYWPNIIITFSTVISMLLNLFHFKEVNICLRKLSIVNDTLMTLGIPKEYRRLYKSVIRLIIGWIILVCLINGLDSLMLMCNSFTNCILVPLIGNYMLCVNTFNGIMCGTILRYIGSKFQQINKYLNNMLEDRKKHVLKLHKLIVIQQKTEARKCKQPIWSIMHVYLELYHISRIWNRVFGIQMTLQMISSFVLLIANSLDFYRSYILKERRECTLFKQTLNILITCFWIVISNINLFTFNNVCQFVCNETNEIVTVLHKLSNNSFDKNLREQILQFILQIKQTEIKFAGIGTVHFGYNFIRRFYTLAATVIVIMIQTRFYEIQ